MTQLCLVRHGETDWNSVGMLQGRKNIPLNNTGILQAQECREFLKLHHWDIIITSPLKRAKETAEIINSELNIPIMEMVEFIERDYGAAEGMTVPERLTAFPNKNYTNQEDRETLTKRVLFGIQKINQLYLGKKVLLVAHGGVINSILAHFSNGEIGSGKTKLINACISNIEFIDEQWKIQNFNQIDHLTQYRNE